MARRTTGFSMEVLGIRELNAAFSRLEREVQEQILGPALKQGAEQVAATARSLVPARTGRLRDSIKVWKMLQGTNRRIKSFGYEVVTGTREELGIEEDDPYYYPAIIEYGATYGRLKERSTLAALARAVGVALARVVGATGIARSLGFYSGSPYMRPAADMHEMAIRAAVGRALAQGQERILREAGAQRELRGGD